MSTPSRDVDVKTMLQEVAAHPVPEYARKFYYCFGGLTFLTFVIQVLTGILLAVYYKPTPEAAYESVKFITDEVALGAVVRSVHRICSNLMVVLVILHMLRVIYTGSYKRPRQFNWVVGVTLLLLTLGFCFTGYLLIWDQVGYWAAVIGTQIMGSVPVVGDTLLNLAQAGSKVSGYTLTRFYALHIVVLPVVTIVFLVIHFIMVRKQGISGGL
ncbi:selenite/tellurite reduction operon b-type cytochrome ExtP [Desulforamulus ruminis]|uniref:selenite/tellurite reduction operon b-type cytochrome ExtP n=1 Tax=Desulforamulus ruminis TaxID=1564 RepID=UPI0023540DB5|nr:selenite/tellurite reduction operon b-type cytochrome ExtP [Desulforamulus ruminis]